MKTLFISLLALCSALGAHSQQVFSTVSYTTTSNNNVIDFSLPREVNVYTYRIEGSNDSMHFEVIGTIRSNGNSVSTRYYSYEVTDASYACYRVAMVDMNARLYYSGIVHAPKDMPHTLPTSTPKPERAIVVNRR